MTFSLLTYNILFNRAFYRLEKIFSVYTPDILCFQEVDTSDENLRFLEQYGYKLADFSNSLIKFGTVYGIATYYNPKKIKLIDANSFDLPKSLYEMITAAFRVVKGGNKPRTILRTNFSFTKSNKIVTVYNIHLSLFGINSTRTKQLEIALQQSVSEKNLPTIITGDFNYFPYRRKKLENLMTKYGFQEATKNLVYTLRILDRKFAKYNFFQNLLAQLFKKYYRHGLKPDYTFYKKIKLIKTERIEKEFSDHYPIISTFSME